jgi:hypothetical protein
MDRSFYSLLTDRLLGDPQDFGGMLPSVEQEAARRNARMAMAASLLQSSGPSEQKRSTLQNIGAGIMAGRQANAESGDAAMRKAFMAAQIQAMLKKQHDVPSSIQEYEYASKNGFAGSFDEWKRVASIEAKDPASIQEYDLAKSQGYQGTFEQWVKDRAQAAVGTPYVPMVVGGVPGFGNRQNASFTPSGTLPGEADAAAQIKEAEARAAELAKAQAGRDATFQEDVNVLDDEILRTQRLLTEFKAGKYQTGPLAGKLPNFRTSAQDLQREQGKDVIKAISSATFGALSEGEREFLRNLGISENASEESNINMLEQRLTQLQKTKERLRTRSRLGVGPNAAPSAVEVGQTTTINGAKVRRVR